LGFCRAPEAQLVKITLESRQTREDSGNVSVQQGIRLIEGNTQNSPRRVIPNSRQRTNLLVVLGERPSKAANQFLGGLVQVTGAAIVAKS
jgi:hypothetical protein